LGGRIREAGLEPQHVLLVTISFAAIGFGFGNIFANRRPSERLLVFYWAFTLGLVAMIFSGVIPVVSLPTQVTIAGTIGALIGLAVGIIQMKLYAK
jgi:hypothetical protein